MPDDSVLAGMARENDRRIREASQRNFDECFGWIFAPFRWLASDPPKKKAKATTESNWFFWFKIRIVVGAVLGVGAWIGTIHLLNLDAGGFATSNGGLNLAEDYQIMSYIAGALAAIIGIWQAKRILILAGVAGCVVGAYYLLTSQAAA